MGQARWWPSGCRRRRGPPAARVAPAARATVPPSAGAGDAGPAGDAGERDLRGIVLMSTVLVVATAGVVATVAHAFRWWGAAWVLGAAVAPTDATAVGVLARALPAPQRQPATPESLINDGTALVIYGLAVSITVGAEPSASPTSAGSSYCHTAAGRSPGRSSHRVGIRGHVAWWTIRCWATW